MSVLGNSQLLMAPEGYQIQRSVRLRSSASAYFSRTPASAGNRKTWTWSAWVKRGVLSTQQTLFSSNQGIDRSFAQIVWQGSDNAIDFLGTYDSSGVVQARLTTSTVYRDPSAWYHIVAVFDTTNATSTERIRLYVNGVRVTAFASTTYPSQNYDGFVNAVQEHTISSLNFNSSRANYVDGYMTEVNFIDGQALTPSSFGEIDAVTGVWKPKKYAGTYGTNGFYLNFSDNSNNTAATIGKDSSGNGNNWTPNNISVTSGATYDSMIDTPTPYADGGNGRGNYCVLNPLRRNVCTITNANLTASGPITYTKSVVASMSMSSGSGKWYWEGTATRTGTTDGDWVAGIVSLTWNAGEATGSPSVSPGNTTDSWGVTGNSGDKINNASQTAYGGTTIANGDVVMVAYDAVNGSLFVGKNGTWYNSGNPATNTNPAFTGITTEVLPAFGLAYDSGSSVVNANFGQRPFAYTPPTGFKALNTQNLPDPTIKAGNKYFDVNTYTGTGATQTITNSGGFQPDFVWIKSRNNAGSNHLYDALRGSSLALFSDTTNADNSRPNSFTSFNSNGFTLGSSSDGNTNLSTYTYVGWQWKKGATQGFDIVTYTGTGSATTVNHSLGVAPKMVIVKSRSYAGTQWVVWHTGLTSGAYTVYLNLTNAQASAPTVWNSTIPTSTVFSVGTNADSNNNGSTYVAYLFSEVAGFSKFGSYTGNGSTDGPFVYCGFRPRWVMWKRTDVSDNWNILDTSRNSYNLSNSPLYPNLSNAEGTGNNIDILSNGFKVRDSGTPLNASGGTYIFAAFAENPFKNSLAR